MADPGRSVIRHAALGEHGIESFARSEGCFFTVITAHNLNGQFFDQFGMQKPFGNAAAHIGNFFQTLV